MMMIVGDVIRGLLFLSIPLFPHLTWIYVAEFLAGVASQFFNPAARRRSIPDLGAQDRLEPPVPLRLLPRTAFGAPPVHARPSPRAVQRLELISEEMAAGFRRLSAHASNVDLALYFNAAFIFISALTVYFIHEIPKRHASGKISVPSTLKSIWDGWRFVGEHPGGARAGARDAGRLRRGRRGGRPGLHLYSRHAARRQRQAGGWSSPRSSSGWRSAWRWAPRCSATSAAGRLFGVTITAAAVPLALIALIPVLAVVVLLVVLVGALSGIAYATGFTIVGLEVDDDTRGRVFAFFQSTIQVILLASSPCRWPSRSA